MTEVPKIVHDRLQAASPGPAAPERAHPEADLLVAFAEQALSVTERVGVLDHLALCRDCREVLHLALPAADAAALPIAIAADDAPALPMAEKTDRNWLTSRRLAWPTLRWAALAAAVVVVASVLLVRPGKLNQPIQPSVNSQVATNLPPASLPRIASSSESPASAVARTDEVRPMPEISRLKKPSPVQAVTPSNRAESGILVADNKRAENKKDSALLDKLSATPSAGARPFDAPASRAANETVEVTAEATPVPAPAATETLMARNTAPAIEKAKPALQEMDAAARQKSETTAAGGGVLPQAPARDFTYAAKLASPANPAAARNTTWAIAAGILQRSLDGGQTWQTALHPDHPLLCYAPRDREVWTGGQAGALFHSADGGVTWLQVRPSVKAQTLTSDITHIDLLGAAEIVVSTNNNEVWSSADGGKTWEKK